MPAGPQPVYSLLRSNTELSWHAPTLRSELLVGSVAVRSVCRALALAQPRFFRRVCGKCERRECRALVGSIAQGLRFGFPAAAPIVGLAGFELYGRGLTSCDLGICHGPASSVRG